MDIPRIFNITESAHRIHNPFTPEKFATLGAALRLESETRVVNRDVHKYINKAHRVQLAA